MAVTFTNKATAEMKERILETLYGLTHRLDSSRDYLEVLQKRLMEIGEPMSEEIISKRASEVLSHILHDYTHFRVETIDSFFQSILRNLAHELGLSANLQVELNSDEVISRAVDRVIDHIQDNEDIERWVLDYVEEQMNNDEKWNISGQVKSFARCIYEESFQKRSETDKLRLNDAKLIGNFKCKLNAIKSHCKKCISEEAEKIKMHVENQDLDFNRISHGNYYTSHLEKAANMTAEEPNNTMQRAMEDFRLLLKKADQNNPDLLQQAENVASIFSKFLVNYNKARREYISASLALRYLNPLRLLNCIEQEANNINAENNQFNLSQTPTLLSQLIEKSDAPFIFEKAGTMFRNVMIDEFQDTSRLQWDNFKVLLLENQSQGGRNLLVGDIKQSIYRWRNGDWEILKNVKNELRQLQPNESSLTHNFRSRQQVVEFNNRFFQQAATVLDAMKPNSRFSIADIYNDVKQQCKSVDGTGHVRLQLYKKKGNQQADDYEERMVTEMVTQIRDLMAGGLELRNMAILVRNNKSTTALLNLFHRMAPDIRLVSDEAFLLDASVSVQMIVSALHVLWDKGKTNPVPERYLMLHYQQDVLHRNVSIEDVANAQPEEMLPEVFCSQQEYLCQLPLYLLCERLYSIFCLSEIKGQDAYLFTFFDELQAHLRNNPSDIHTFLSAWDSTLHSRSIPGGEVPGIRILTIHKSKGLQFHTVLLPYMDWGIEDDKKEDLLWCDTDEKPFDSLGSLPIRCGKDMESSIFSDNYQEEHLQRRVDALNIMYVAFTRAESNLMVWGSTGAKQGEPTTAGDIIYNSIQLESQGEDEFLHTSGSPVTGQKAEKLESDNKMKSNHSSANAIPIQMRSSAPTLDFRQSNLSKRFITDLSQPVPEEEGSTKPSYLEIGKIMHYVLSQIEYEDEAEHILSRCLNEGLISDSQMASHILHRLERGFSDPMVRHWFSREMTVFNECSITYTDPSTGLPSVKRPDRVVMSGGQITVIDFKFGRAEEEHREQVRGYVDLLRSMYPGRQVEGWLWYIYTGQKVMV